MYSGWQVFGSTQISAQPQRRDPELALMPQAAVRSAAISAGSTQRDLPVADQLGVHIYSGVTDTALGDPRGLLNSLVVLAFRTGSFFPPCAKAALL
jgi:hypothetical protein